MGLANLLRSLGHQNGIEIDDDELASLGLSDEDVSRAPAPDGDVLSTELPGDAAGAVELFLSKDTIGLKEVVQDDEGLMWEPIIREGQWAVRPGGKTGKRRAPLKVVAGKSTNQRKQIGLQDLLDAFNAKAIEHVTVPTSHNNHVLENTGFIKGMKIVDGTYTPKGKTDPVKVKVLMGGYDIRKPSVKESMTDGSIASRSAGILYDYVDTETGMTWPAVVEHVALTNKPWITGMTTFGRKLKGVGASNGATVDPVVLSLSNEEPDDVDLLAQEDALKEIQLSTGDLNLSWAKEDSPNWLKQQVNMLLNQARSKKIQERRKTAKDNNGGAALYVDFDYPPSYRCVEAKPGSALISDSWGDDANFWSAPIIVKDGAVQLESFDKWDALKKDYVPDERPTPPKDRLPLDQQDQKTSEAAVKLSRRELAVQARKSRATNDNSNPPRGGEHMADENERLQLSEEARRLIQEAEDRARRAEEQVTKLSQDRERDNETLSEIRADRKIDALKLAGFTEDRGFGGVLAYARNVYLADDGEPALAHEAFSTDSNATGELSLGQVMDGLFAAFKRGEDGKVMLSEQVTQPASKKEGEGEETAEEAGKETTLSDGKPGGKDGEEKEVDFALLSQEEQDKILAEELADTPLADFVKSTTTGAAA